MILAFSVDKETKTIYCSDGTICDKPAYLDYLLSYPKTIMGFVSLDDDVAQLLTLLDLSKFELEKLCDSERLFIPPYTLKYFKGKMFSISKGHGLYDFALFCDMAQYEPQLDHVEPRHDAAYHLDRAKTAAQVGQEVYEALKDIGLSPRNLISPSNAYKDRMKSLYIPTIKDIPAAASEIAYESCAGNWVEVYQRGHFDYVTDLDLTSAYPYEASKLIDLRYGSWKHRDEYQDKATYGYCRCEVSIDSDFSPVPYKANKNNMVTPKGIWECCLTKGMIDFIHEYNIGFVTILDGWWWFADPNHRKIYPMKKEIDTLFELKTKSDGRRKDVVKRIMSGNFYGNFIQTTGDRLGDFFCSPYAAEIEANTRIADCKLVLDNNLTDRVISITVDGVVVDGVVKVPDSKAIGSWRISNQGEAIVVNPSLICVEGKFGEGDFSLSLEELKQIIQVNPDLDEYQKEKYSVITLAMAVNSGKLDDLGTIQKRVKVISLNDSKRDWIEDFPETGADLLSRKFKSKAWTTDWLKILNMEAKSENQYSQ